MTRRRETLEQRPVQSHARSRDTLALDRFQPSMLEPRGRKRKRVQTEENWEALLPAGLCAQSNGCWGHSFTEQSGVGLNPGLSSSGYKSTVLGQPASDSSANRSREIGKVLAAQT